VQTAGDDRAPRERKTEAMLRESNKENSAGRTSFGRRRGNVPLEKGGRGAILGRAHECSGEKNKKYLHKRGKRGTLPEERKG